MGENEGEITATEPGASDEKESTPAQDTLQVPAQKKKKLKSPTPGSVRGRSATPIRGRSQTPFNLYMTRRSATPSTWRSITPFLNREEKEKTPFELGRDIKSQTTCNIAVFDRALIMDISEPEDLQKPVRYITSDMSVIDRAAVMDVSNVEVIYVVEEYEEYEEEEEIIEEVKPKKKDKKPRKGRTPRKSMESDSTLLTSDAEIDGSEFGDREDSIDLDDEEESDKKKPKKKAAIKKKKEEKKEKSPSPKLTLKLEIGGGQKGAKKMFEQQQAGAGPKPPPKKSKLVLQMEEQAKAAAKAAEEEAARVKPKGETFEEKQKRLAAEKEEEERLAAEARAQEEEEMEAQEVPEEGEEGYEPEDGSYQPTEMGEEDAIDEYKEEGEEASELADEVTDLPEKRRGSDESLEFTRPDPYDEERWQRIAAEEGEDFMQHLRKYSLEQRRSEKERDADWQKRREQARIPHFINFLTDRTAEAGQSVRLACAVGGPDLSVKWFKDKRQLERDGTHRIINNNNILALEVLNTNILDSGEYSCIVSNSNDEVTSSCIVTIYEVFKDEPKPPSFRFIKDYYHLRDDELTIECHIYGVPRPIVSWWRGAFEVKPSYKYTKLEEAHGEFKLLIYKPTSKDNGIYICKAINSQGEAQIAHTVEVTKNRHFHARGIFHARDRFGRDKGLIAKKAMEEALKSKAASDLKRAEEEPKVRAARASPEPMVPVKQKLSFATQLRDRMALEGTTVRFVCTVIGPQPSCRWQKDDKWVVVGPNIRNLSEEGKAILELVKVSAEASGVYKCVAKNEVSEIETSCYFKVYSAQTDGDEQEPIFALPLRDVYHTSQNDLIIDTKVRGNPRPVISWVKDDLPVVLDDRIVQIEHLDGVCELIINKPTTNDNGVYTCICENKLGSQKITHTVVIEPIHISRRSSVLSGVMSETDNTGAGKPRPDAVLPPRANQDESESGGYERRSRLPDVSPKQQLYFVANISNRYVAEGSKVKLQAVIGGPDPILKWMKDDQNVSYGPRIRNMNRDGLAVLEFINVLEEDSGKYTCMAQNEFCKISSTAVLHVYQSTVNQDEPPVFVRPIKDTYHLTSNELILETGIRGQPTPEVQWFKDSIEIQNGGKFTLFQTPDGSCELIIDYPDHKDSGKYLIKAENRAGKVEIVHNVLFKGKDSHIADNIHGVYHADKSLLRPKKVEEEKPKPIAQPKPSESDAVAETSEESGKRRGSRRKSRKGDEEEEGYVSSTTDYASDTGSMKKREKVIGIHFATSVRDRVVAEGSKVRISCFLEAKEPQVKWFKNDEPIVNGPKIRGRYSEGLCLLEINSVEAEDSGEYRCWGRDETGEASTSCTLEVFADPGTGDIPPTFTRNIKDTLHGKLNELQLDVHVRGLPTPTVTWVKDGVKIEPNEKYQVIEHDDGTCELFVNKPTPQDSGKYVCQAENREGKTEIVHNVTVEARSRRISPSREGRPPKPIVESESTDGQTENDASTKRKKSKPDEEESGSSRREVPPPPDLKKRLYFRNFLSNRTVKSGSNVKWMVSIDGPDPVARWYHGDQPIAFGPQSKMSCQDGIAWLNLVGVTEEDSGEYTLKVKGSENEVVSTCTLFVYSVGAEEKVAPVFTVGIKEIFQSQNNEICLECKVTGDPKPLIYWHKDHDLLINNNQIKCHELHDGTIQLILSNPSIENSGLYTCNAKNEHGFVKISKFLNVADYINTTYKLAIEETSKNSLVKSKMIRSNQSLRDFNTELTVESLPKHIKVTPGSKAQLTCFINGFIENVYWLKSGNRITKDKRHKMFNTNGALVLEILDVTTDDSGDYKCVVENSQHSIETTNHLTVLDDIDIGSEIFVHPLLKNFDTERNELILYCQVLGRPTITWMRDDHPISNNRYMSVEDVDGIRKLIIRNPIVSDCRQISCVAETENTIETINTNILSDDLDHLMATTTNYKNKNSTNSYQASKYFSKDEDELEFISQKSQEPEDLQIPRFTKLLQDKTCLENTDVCVSCIVTCKENAHINWFKDETPLLDNQRYQTYFHSGKAILKINQSKCEDSGQYSCRISNEYGEAFNHCQLHISKAFDENTLPPTFTQSMKDTYSLNENELVLDCRVRGKPQPTITWMKGLDLIVNNDKYQTHNESNGYSKLVISSPTVQDSGIYSCVARNEVSENKMTHHVDFKGREHFTLEKTHGFFHRDPNKPHFLAPLGNQTVSPGGTVAITAEFMQCQTPIEVNWLRDRKSIHGQPNVKTFYDRGVYTLALINAGPETEGTYTCRASNAFGRIESHATVDVAVGVEKEERPPLFLSRPDTEMKIAIGDPFSISFRIAGEPKPKLTFMKGTKDITKSDRISKEVSDDYTRFTVQKAQISDSGTYFVVARNNFGTDRIFVTITVYPRARSETPSLTRWGQPLDHFSEVSYFKDPPGPISTEPYLDDCGASHLCLAWGKPFMKNAAPVMGYKVDVWIVGHEGGAFWKELGFTPINSFGVLNLKQNLEYHFRVTPKNRYGWGPSVQTKYPLKVCGVESIPEFVEKLPGHLKILLNDTIKLECLVCGVPHPRITWYKNGLPLLCNSERITLKEVGSKCTLTITRVSDSDTGRYTCEASNWKGSSSTYASIQVVTDQRLFEADNKLKQIINDNIINLKSDSLPLFTMRLRDRRAQVDHPIRFTCQILGYPTPVVTWHKNSQIISPSERYHITEDGQFYTLEIASTTLDDSGIYTCTAKNIQGSISCNCSLVVDKGIRTYITPEFMVPLDPLYIFKEGQDIRLTARVEAYPSVAVSWLCNGIKLRQSRRIIVTLDQYGVVELLIKTATLRDEGIYECTASNAVGKVQNCCRLQIEPNEDYHKMNSFKSNIKNTNELYSKEPLFVVKPRSSEAFEGDTVIIYCEVIGDPKPEVVWLRDFLKPDCYKDASHFQIIGEGPEYRLEIPDVKLDYTGSYSVIAKNCHGETKAVISLQIYVKNILSNLSMEKGTIRPGNVETIPRFIRHLKDIRCCDGDAIVLECQVEAIPEPIVIWEKDGHVISNEKDLLMSYDGVKATLSILRIFPEDEGVYTCVARNILGRNFSVGCVIVDIPEEKETMLNTQILATSELYSQLTADVYSHGSRSKLDIGRGRFNTSRLDTLHRAFRGPKFITIPQSRVVEEGDTVRFQCTVSENPPTWCTWDKDGMIVTPTSRIKVREIDDVRILEIEKVTFDDSGLYRITLKNEYGRIESTARLDVICKSRSSESSSSTEIVKYSSKRNYCSSNRGMGPYTTRGERLTISRVYRGSSVPPLKYSHKDIDMDLIDWKQNEHLMILAMINFYNYIDKVGTITMQFDKFKTHSIICLEQLERDGLLFNYIYHDERAICHLINEYKVSTVDETLIDTTLVRQTPSQHMKEFNNVNKRSSDNSSKLMTKNIKSDASEINMNNWNMEMSTISVAVEGPPDPTTGKPNISLESDHIVITWCGPQSDGGCKITGFIIEMECCLNKNIIGESEKWQELARVEDSFKYTVKNVKPNLIYRFRVIAENMHGRSVPGLPSEYVHLCPTDTKKEISLHVMPGGDFKERFEILEEIGKGRFGTVFKVQEKEEPYQILAAKVIKCRKSSDYEKVKEEISIMELFNHPKLLKLQAFFETPRNITMVMEYITGGELFERVVADDFSLTELDCRLFIRQVCEGVEYMHDNHIVHLDLKPENIMCQSRTSHEVKIIDFGLAQRIQTDAPVRVMFGTPEFISPEIINYEPIGFQSDMWSIGVVSYVLLSGLSPFMGDCDVDTFSNIIRADCDFDDDAFDEVSQEAKDFISNLLVHKKEDRLTAKQCLESKWLNVHNKNENLSNNKICTDKLKKFIIRRKWQKTGNAIRALGRMVNLSASRRNSAINGSIPNSPRPSISGFEQDIYSCSNLTFQMECLHKEVDTINQEIHSNLLSEKIDNTPLNITSLSNAVPHNLLKSKLDDIAKEVNSEEFTNPSENTHKSIDRFTSGTHENCFRILPSSSTKEIMMLSDFTNTVKMRKSSLAKNISRGRYRVAKPTIEFTTKGKVSLLKTKFNEHTKILPMNLLTLKKPPQNKVCMEKSAYANMDALKNNFGSKETKHGSSNHIRTLSTTTQSPTTSRVSNKVREMTDRIVYQQNNISSAKVDDNLIVQPSRKILSAHRPNKTL